MWCTCERKRFPSRDCLGCTCKQKRFPWSNCVRCIYERKRLAVTDCVGCTCDRKWFRLYNCIFLALLYVFPYLSARRSHTTSFCRACVPGGHIPDGFWVVWEGPPYRPHSLGDGSKCRRGKRLKTVCLGAQCTSGCLVYIASDFVELHMRSLQLIHATITYP